MPLLDTSMDVHRQKCSSLNPATVRNCSLGGQTTYVPDLGRRSPPSSHFLGLSPPNHYVPLALSTKCDICLDPIPSSNTRFHCFQCNDGDHNICTTSYLKLISAGQIGVNDGDKGWRRCLKGHRMIVIGFEDSSAGQRRVIVNDLVGGHGMKDDGRNEAQSRDRELSWQDGDQRHVRTVSQRVALNKVPDVGTAASPLLQNYPPSGGLGLRVVAMWSYWPQDAAEDDLSFPRGAEIQEVENINGDWYLGYYAGKTGLFPEKYVRVLDTIRP
ncbi:MAG: hypothetical protein Q9181_003026 [Wetmoreana brouardii]